MEITMNEEPMVDLLQGQAIGENDIRRAQDILRKYREGKHHLDETTIENEDWYKLQHRRYFKDKKFGNLPFSAWMFNSIWGKHADAMDNYPEPVVLPRERSDEKVAQTLSTVIPVILKNCKFHRTYSIATWDKLKNGTCIYGIFWDQNLYNGLGDIAITAVDMLDFYWEPGVKDIQDSQNIFQLAVRDNDSLVAEYPQLKDRLGNFPETKRYNYDESIDLSDKSVVVDWYYKKHNGSATVVHYVKFVDDNLLYASENDPACENGFYETDQYPFVMDVLFPEKGTPAGFGFVDIARNPQEYIDKLGGDILDNASLVARPRPIIKDSAAINEEEFMDRDKHAVIHVAGDPNQIAWEQAPSMSALYLNILQYKVDELKETTGNRDVTQGSTVSGVTAASAIAALQEAGSKGSRDANASAYAVFEQLCGQVVERIRQFYDLPRTFRITGETGGNEYVQLDNSGLKSREYMEYGQVFKTKLPIFDIDVRAQRMSPYAKISQNELALQFFNLGFFNPQFSDQALACISMMDFDGKQKVEDTIRQNGTMYDQLMRLQQTLATTAEALAMQGDPRVLEAIQAQGLGTEQPLPAQNGDVTQRKGSLADQARATAREGAAVQ